MASALAWRLCFPVDEAVKVLVTHVQRDSGNFFVQINNSDSTKLDDLMEEIVSFASRSSGDSKAKPLKVGDICLAKYVDEVWYRGKVLGVDRNGFKVFFVDYGNSDFVASSDVLPAPDKFLTLPPQAFECELANVRAIGGRWSTEILCQFEELVIEQTFVAQAVSLKTNNVLVLSLFQDATMTTLAVEPLISAGYLERTDDVLAYTQSGPNRSYASLQLDKFSFEDVHISYCVSPNKFYCLLLKNSTALHKLTEELEITYREAPEDDYPLTSCCQDNPCCAKFSEDDIWYRAIITSESPSTSGEINVKFVDYGNSENVHISDLKELDDRFLELPMQALECTLYGIQPTNGKIEWPQDAIELFQALTGEKHLVCYLSNVANNVAEVFLFDTSEETKDINFGQVLVDNGKAVAVKSLTDYKKGHNSQRRKSSFGIINLVPNSSESVVITNAESPSDFYCQLLKHSSDLDKLMDDLSQYYDALRDVDDTITLPQAGMLCCGNYTEDDGWYRALILESYLANRKVEVLYVDYGNIESLPITRIKELKPQFAALPQQAILCCLYGVSPSAPSWTDQAIEEFQNAIVEKELVIKVVSHNESQRYSVSLMETVGDEEYSVNKLLVQKGMKIYYVHFFRPWQSFLFVTFPFGDFSSYLCVYCEVTSS
jgi:tudor domain-containing protein 1/4/6/7